MSDPIVYTIQAPGLDADDVAESVEKAVTAGGYELTGKVITEPTSEIQFDPFTIAAGIWVGKIILDGVATVAVEEMARALLDKVRNKKNKSPEVPAKIVLILPDTTRVELDAADPDLEKKLAALGVKRP